MIRVFGQTDTQFLSNGDCVVSPLKAKVHKKDNSDYYLELEVYLLFLETSQFHQLVELELELQVQLVELVVIFLNPILCN